MTSLWIPLRVPLFYGLTLPESSLSISASGLNLEYDASGLNLEYVAPTKGETKHDAVLWD